MDFQIFVVHDPDGICVEFRNLAACRPGKRPQIPLMVAPNTAQVDDNVAFYLHVVGLDFPYAIQSPGQVFNAWDPSGGTTSFSGALFSVRGADSYWEWLQWTDSPKYPTPYKEGHRVGVARVVIEVDDIGAAHVALKERCDTLGYTVYIGEIEEWNFEPAMGLRNVVNFQDPEGVALQLMENPLPSFRRYIHTSALSSNRAPIFSVY
ncbi:hypothetical protein BJX99DRAFT_260058 [Aspergillus californicus]